MISDGAVGEEDWQRCRTILEARKAEERSPPMQESLRERRSNLEFSAASSSGGDHPVVLQHRESGAIIGVANVHIPFTTATVQRKKDTICKLCTQLAEYDSWIICGDYNLLATSDVGQLAKLDHRRGWQP